MAYLICERSLIAVKFNITIELIENRNDGVENDQKLTFEQDFPKKFRHSGRILNGFLLNCVGGQKDSKSLYAFQFVVHVNFQEIIFKK